MRHASYESGRKPDVSMHVEGTTGMVCPVDVSERSVSQMGCLAILNWNE